MDFKIEKGYKVNFLELLKSTCKKFKVDYIVSFSDEQVIGKKQTIDNRGQYEMAGMGHFMTFGSNVKTTDIIGFIATVEIPELAQMEETGFLYLGCIKSDDIITVHPSGYASTKGFQLTSLKEEIQSFPCAECGKKIARKIIHVFESPEGEVAVYGSGCAVKKFGINFSAVMDKFFNAISVLEDSYYGDDEYFGSGSFGGGVHYAPFFALICFYNIYNRGYISGSKAWNEGGMSTKDMTLTDILMIDSNDISAEKKALVDATNKFADESKLKWEEFVAWIPDFKKTLNDDDFGFNMTSVCDQMVEGGISDRMAGYGCYVIFRYWQDALAPKAPTIEWNEDYSGLSIGDKLKDLGPITAKVTNLFVRETQWGTTTIYTFRDINTNIKYKWFSTSGSLDEDQIQEIWSGTIKHFENDAKYGKAVVLTRCKVRVKED